MKYNHITGIIDNALPCCIKISGQVNICTLTAGAVEPRLSQDYCLFVFSSFILNQQHLSDLLASNGISAEFGATNLLWLSATFLSDIRILCNINNQIPFDSLPVCRVLALMYLAKSYGKYQLRATNVDWSISTWLHRLLDSLHVKVVIIKLVTRGCFQTPLGSAVQFFCFR